jgi:hypothetical protein
MIKWIFAAELTSDRYFGVLVAETRERIFAKVVEEKSGLYSAEIIEYFSHGEEKIAEKKDNSLIELINWVEEELKFRTKNGDIN